MHYSLIYEQANIPNSKIMRTPHQVLKHIPSKFLTLKFRLMALITISLLIVVGGPLFFLVHQLDKNYDEYTRNLIETTSNLAYQSIYTGMLTNDKKSIQTYLEVLSLEPSIRSLRIVDTLGTIDYSTNKKEVGKTIAEFEHPLQFSPIIQEEQELFYKGKDSYYHLHPIYIEKECLKCHQNTNKAIAFMDVEIWMLQSTELYSSIRELTIFSMILIVIILWIVLNFLYQGQIESRLNIIMNGFNQLAKGNLDFKIKMPGRHELAILAQKFNKTVEKLRAAKNKENQYVQESLERADRLVTLGEVATEIAHEVNNPASIILSRAEILKDELDEINCDATTLEDIDIIINQTKKIAEITRNILHYARKLPQKYSNHDLNDIVQQSIKILEPRIKKKRVQVIFRPYKTRAPILANANQLEQVFCNLINNSLDVLPQGEGKIEIDILSEVQNSKQTNYKIFFRDNGPGIPEEYRQQIFSPFFTTKGAGKGTGLGLFIVKNIVTNHRGMIYIPENQSKGTTFIIELGTNGTKN